jgi:hypothetical protein
MKSPWFILAGIFWLGMNLLLWRSEYGTGVSGNPLPVETVLSRILETPDPSELEILYQNQRVGNCRWVVTQLGVNDTPEEVSPGSEVDLEAAEMSGLIRDIKAFSLHLDGHLDWKDQPRRIRFMLDLDLTGDREWTAFDGKIGWGDQWFHIQTKREEEEVRFKLEESGNEVDMSLTPSQLKDPGSLITQWSALNPLMGALLAPFLSQWSSLQKQVQLSSDTGEDWKAFSNWISIAHSRMRVYRVEAQGVLMKDLSLTVNRAGEILHVTLPQGVELKNDAVLGL